MIDAGAPTPPRPTTAGGAAAPGARGQGLHIAALAAAIKVTPRKLEALETDRFDELPDATFTRALAQTVCRTLKIDAAPVLGAAAAAARAPAGAGRRRPERAVPRPARATLAPQEWAACRATRCCWIAAC